MIDGSPQGAWESMALRLDNGAEIAFSGRQFAGGSWYDEETGVLTRQNLYITEANEYVYSIITGTGRQRSRRAYRVALHGKTCTMSDGKTEITLELEMLMLAVRALTGLDREGKAFPCSIWWRKPCAPPIADFAVFHAYANGADLLSRFL